MNKSRRTNNHSRTFVVAAAAVAVAVIIGFVWWQSRAAQGVPLADVSHIHGIAVDPNDPSRLYLATHNGVWLSSPDGTAELISDNRNDYMGFSPHPSQADIFFASGHPATGGNMGLIVSRDGARNWDQVADGASGPVDFHSMDVSPADPNVIYGLYGKIQVSRDGGETWWITGSPSADVFDIAASPVDPDTVFAATRSGLMISRDRGTNWRAAGTAGQPVTMVETVPSGEIYAFVMGAGLIEAQSATSLNWTSVGPSLGEQVLLHLAIDPTDPNRMFAVTQESRVLTSTDGGQSWKALAS